MITNTFAATPWLVPVGDQSAKTRLYCFPHGGGSPAEYVRWARGMKGAAVRVVQLPGRGARYGESPHTRMQSLVEAMANEISFAPPYAFFGHSLGALISYELTHALREAGRPLPESLIVSSYPAPSLPRKDRGFHLLSDRKLLEAVNDEHGGIPREVFMDRELCAMAAAGLRADYSILETYAWQRRDPLPVPMTVLAGYTDTVSGAQLTTWEEHTTEHPITVRTFPGGHFYLQETHRPAVLRTVAAAFGGTGD